MTRRRAIIFILLIILVELLILRFRSALNYRDRLLKASQFTLALIKEPVKYSNNYQILDFGYLKVGSYSRERFRVGDVLQVKLNDKNYAKEINKVSIVWYAVIMRVFSGLKEIINNICLDNLTSPYGELLSGMTLGVKEIPPKFNENLIKTGVIHVVVVSGFNISLVISALFPLFIFLGRKNP